MPNKPDPRLKVAIDYLADQTDIGASEIVDEAAGLLRKLDAEDPLRQPPGDEAMEALLDEWFNGNDWRRGMTAPALVDRMEFARRALTAALAVMAGTKQGATSGGPGGVDTPENILTLTNEQAEAAWQAVVRRLRSSHSPSPESPPDPKPEWTAEKEALLFHLVRQEIPRNVHAEFRRLADKIFPEPAWSPSGCIAHRDICRGPRAMLSARLPHAGERADG